MPIPVFTLENYAPFSIYLRKEQTQRFRAREGFGRTTALHLAIKQSSFIFEKEIKNGSLKDSPLYARLIIESLLRHGALVSARDSHGMTPLHIAAQRNNIVGAKILIEAGSKIMPKDDKGKTPLDYAESAEMIKLLKVTELRKNEFLTKCSIPWYQVSIVPVILPSKLTFQFHKTELTCHPRKPFSPTS